MTNESLVSNENKNESLGLRLEMQNAAIKMFFLARGPSYKMLPQRSGLPSCGLKLSPDVPAARKFGLFSRQLAGCRNKVPQNFGYQSQLIPEGGWDNRMDGYSAGARANAAIWLPGLLALGGQNEATAFVFETGNLQKNIRAQNYKKVKRWIKDNASLHRSDFVF